MILYDTQYLQLKSAKSPSGGEWVYAHRPNVSDVIVILPIIENSKVLFIIETRPPIYTETGMKYTVGLPAGLVGDVRKDESPEDAVKTELLEEAGLIADELIIKANNIASSAGCTSECYTIAIAKINKYELKSKPQDDGGIIIDRVLVNIEDIGNWLKQKQQEGMVLTSQMLSALYYLKEEI